MADSPEEWDRKMQALRRMQLLYSQSGRRASGGVAVPASNPLQDEFYVAITTEDFAEIFV